MKIRSLVAAAALVPLAIGPAWAAPPDGGESPEALAKRVSAAAAADDIADLVACAVPAERPLMSMSMLVGASMMVAMYGMGAAMGGMMADAAGEMTEDDEAKAEAEAELAAVEARGAELAAKLDSILTKHGLPSMDDVDAGDQSAAEEMFKDIDHGSFLSDIFALMGEAAEEGDSGPQLPQGDLEDLEIDGDRASGSIGGNPVHFVRLEDGRWYLTMGPDAP